MVGILNPEDWGRGIIIGLPHPLFVKKFTFYEKSLQSGLSYDIWLVFLIFLVLSNFDENQNQHFRWSIAIERICMLSYILGLYMSFFQYSIFRIFFSFLFKCFTNSWVEWIGFNVYYNSNFQRKRGEQTYITHCITFQHFFNFCDSHYTSRYEGKSIIEEAYHSIFA